METKAGLRGWLPGIAVALVLLLPAPASAVVRNVVPGGSGSDPDCTTTACSLAHVVDVAGSGDEVVLASGTYNLGGAGLTFGEDVDVRGAPGQPRPVVTSSNATRTLEFDPPLVNTASISHVHVLNTAAGASALVLARTTAEDLVLEAPGAGATAARVEEGALLRNTAALAGQGFAVTAANALVTGANIRNVTAIGGPAGVRVASGTLSARNVIARGTEDLQLDSTLPTTSALTIGSSNYRPSSVQPTGPGESLVDLGFNQSGAPAFANFGAGDFHQVAGSPTIDAGGIDPLAGLTDFDGEPRHVGLFPDIGADEYVPLMPVVFTGDPGAVEDGTVTLNGTVNPNGKPTSWLFEYGTGAGYQQQTAQQALPSGNSTVPVSAQLTGLEPGQVVHYRLVAQNADGRADGLDRIVVVPPLELGDGGDDDPLAAISPPQFTGIDLPTTPVVGEPTTLTVSAQDPDSAVNGFQVEFGERDSLLMMSACRIRRNGQPPRSGVFAPGRAASFDIPYVFQQTGVHEVRVTIFSGACTGSPRTVSETITVVAGPPAPAPKTRLRSAGVEAHAAQACGGANATPRRRNRRTVRRATRCLLNSIRSGSGMRRLRANRRLTRSAAAHNRDMQRRRYLAHDGPGGPRLAQRARAAGYRSGAGENIGVGSGVFGTARGMTDMWMRSPVHRANILYRPYRSIGISILPRKPLAPHTPGATYVTNMGLR